MDNKPKRVIEAVFKNIYGRECKYYQRSGILWWAEWEEVPYGTEGGFFEGAVVTEAQLNFTHEKYGSGDIYLLLDFAAGIGIVLISAVVVVDVTLAVMAKLEALAFYVENFGVRQGFEMYKYLGVENLPNGVISWLQADMADGDSSVDDLVEGGGYSNLDEGLNFAKKAAEHMEDSARHVPMQTLQDAIRYGEALPDPQGSDALMYYTTMYKDGKMYNLEVLYDEVTNTVYHFKYTREAIGNLPAIK